MQTIEPYWQDDERRSTVILSNCDDDTTAAYVATRPSLELRWLPNSFLKQLPYYPTVVFREGAGGYYYSPTPSTNLLGETGLMIDTSRGVLEIGNTSEEDSATILAHELRHHWQWTNKRYAQGWWSGFLRLDLPYWDAITEFFSFKECEFDALRFQKKTTPSDVTTAWWIHLEKQAQGFFR